MPWVYFKMAKAVEKTVIFLDMVLLVMTCSWILFGITKGIDFIESIYNYIYVLVAIVTSILNIILIRRK